MVGLRGSQVHQWVVAGVAVLVLSGDEGIRAQSQESARRTGYDGSCLSPSPYG